MVVIESWIIIATLCFLFAGTVKGTLGIGLPIAAIGAMTLFIDPRIAISLMVFPIMITNMWQCYRAGNVMQALKKYKWFAIILLTCLLATTYFTAKIPVHWLLACVGVIILVFALMNLSFSPPPIPDRLDQPAQWIFAVFAGVLGGLTAIWSPPIAMYLIARNASKDEFVRVTGILFFIGSLPLCIGFYQNGLLTGELAMVSVAMIIPSLIGFSIGEAIRRTLDPKGFRLLVLVCFILIGLNLIRKALIAA